MGSCLQRLPSDPQQGTVTMSLLGCFAINNILLFTITTLRSPGRLMQLFAPTSLTTQHSQTPTPLPPSWGGHHLLAGPSGKGRVWA